MATSQQHQGHKPRTGNMRPRLGLGPLPGSPEHVLVLLVLVELAVLIAIRRGFASAHGG